MFTRTGERIVSDLSANGAKEGEPTEQDVDRYQENQDKNRFLEYNQDFKKKPKAEPDGYNNLDNLDVGLDEPTNADSFLKQLVRKLIRENMVDEDGHRVIKPLRAVDSSKLEEMLVQQLEKQRKKKPFERMHNLYGLTRPQYIEKTNFDKHYQSRKNHGVAFVEKQKHALQMAREVFNCWDTARMGHISLNALAQNLISLGLATSKDEVLKLFTIIKNSSAKTPTSEPELVLTDKNWQEEEITLKQFIRIFEKDRFSEKAMDLIKSNCFTRRVKKLEEESAKA